LNYVFSYDTTTQTIVTPNTFQDITFSNNSLINGWTHTASTSSFTAPTLTPSPQIFEITWMIESFNTALLSTGYTVSAIALQNAVQIAGSQMSNAIPSATLGLLGGAIQSLNNSFLVSISSGDVIKVQWTSTSGSSELTAQGSGTVKVSANMVIFPI
jgi:hypothetical protein